ncbi:MAG: hypothetical protein ACFCU5_16765 [Pleurocapsa sp.]
MPNKRSRRGKVHHFPCPYCQQRLWRVGADKYYLFYQDIADIRENLQLTKKKASLLQGQYPVFVDKNRWIEEFFCPEDGKLWLLISRQADGSLTQTLATEKDWQKTSKTINPHTLNPSISEYSYRMSRSSQSQNRYYQKQKI